MASPIPGFSSSMPIESQVDGRLRRLRPALGALCSIEAVGEQIDLEDAINRAFQAIQKVNRLMHPVRGVDLSRINRLTKQVLSIDEWTWQVLQLARQLHQLSEGVFDPCLPSQPGGMADIELLDDRRVICHQPVQLDLGGIAKGFAVDVAIDVLRTAGCSSALVNAGGDVRVYGETQNMRLVYGEQVLQLALQDQALAVTAFDHADRPGEHQGYYCRNLEMRPLHSCVAVTASTTAVADALTKCGMFFSRQLSENMFAKLNAQLVLAASAPVC